MTLVGRLLLDAFMRKHAATRPWLLAWLAEVEDAAWRSPQDIKDRYRTASFLPDKNVVFNVKGNRFRIICKVVYNSQIVIIKWVGTHADYSKLS